MIHLKCAANRTIFVPVDSSLRMAIVVPDHKSPHSHPMPPMVKVSFEAKAAYRDCVIAQGVVAATTKKVDIGELIYSFGRMNIHISLISTAASTKVILNGKTPGQVYPALNNVRVKNQIVKKVKTAQFPFGTDKMGKQSTNRGL